MSPVRMRVSVGDQGVLNEAVSAELLEIWIDRDLSWLDFNQRVLTQALDERTPLLERAKFLAIFSSNLDEFFMKRVAVLREKLTPERTELLHAVRAKLLPLLKSQADCFHNTIVPGLAPHGIVFARWRDLSRAQRERASEYFDEQVSPALIPLVIDPSHPFPFLSNLSTSLAFSLRHPRRQETKYARVKVPGELRQWVALEGKGGEKVLVQLHEIIRGNLEKLYAGMELGPVTVFRVTRDAEVELDSDSDGEPFPELVEEQVRQRRYEPVVRVEFGPEADTAIRTMLCDHFQLLPLDLYDIAAEIDYTSLFEIASLEIPELRDHSWVPILPPAFTDADPDVFALIRERDVLVHHPYDSFDDTVGTFRQSGGGRSANGCD